jgi:hypothetical protein
MKTPAPDLQTELDQAKARLAELELQKAQREADSILADYSHLPKDTLAVLRDQLLADPAKGKTLLEVFPKNPPPKRAAPAELPPKPTHDPAAAYQAKSPEEKVAAGNELIEKIRAEGKFTDYTAARGEARRQRPDLFS